MNCQIIPWNREEVVFPLLFAEYKKEFDLLPDLPQFDEAGFADHVKGNWGSCEGLLAVSGGAIVGVMLYAPGECVAVPVWGTAGTQEVRIRLFQALARETLALRATRVRFSVRLYAHDTDSILTFCRMQFGMECETCLRRIPEKGLDESGIRELTKGELAARWSEVWGLTNAVVRHLRESPVFYPGEEFTEGLYREFFMDGNTHVVVAEEDGRFIGLIEWNGEGQGFGFAGQRAVNVGEAYVLPEYRGTGLAEKLLAYAESAAKRQGFAFSWVMHGTANPNATGFWNKYFDPFEVEMVRIIEKV